MRQTATGQDRLDRANNRMAEAMVRAAERMEIVGAQMKSAVNAESNRATVASEASSVGRSRGAAGEPVIASEAAGDENMGTEATEVHPLTPTAATSVEGPAVQLLRSTEIQPPALMRQLKVERRNRPKTHQGPHQAETQCKPRGGSNHHRAAHKV